MTGVDVQQDNALRWQRLGEILRTERRRQGLSRGRLAEMASVSAGSIQDAEGGRVPLKRRPYTLDAIERALGWGAGSIDSILDGGQPVRRSMGISSDVQPGWVYDLISAVDTYEQEHGGVNDGWPCLHDALASVPEQELDRARAIASYKRGSLHQNDDEREDGDDDRRS